MDALQICEKLFVMIPDNRIIEGQVHSVFKNACNIVLNQGDVFAVLLSSNRVMSPMSVRLSTYEGFDFRTLGMKQDMSLHIENGVVKFEDLDLKIDINTATGWNPEPFEIKQHYIDEIQKNLGSNIDALINSILAHGRFSGMEILVKELTMRFDYISLEAKFYEIEQTDKEIAFIKARFNEFIEAVVSGNQSSINLCARNIIGYGKGLTPSIDDFVTGIMITNIYMSKFLNIPNNITVRFNDNIINQSTARTTRISSEMMKNAVFGYTNETVRYLMQQLFIGKAKDVEKALMAAVNFGETSGTDTALGIYVALKIWTNNDYRRVMLNEFLCGNQKKHIL